MNQSLILVISIILILGISIAYINSQRKIEPFGYFFASIGNKIKNVILGPLKKIGGILLKPIKTIIGFVKAIPRKIGNFFKKIWRGIKSAFSKIWNGIKKVFKKIGGFFKKIWEGIKKIGTFLWNGIKKVFVGIYNFFKMIFKNMVKAFKFIWNIISDPIGFIIGMIAKLLNFAFGGIAKIFNQAMLSYFPASWRKPMKKYGNYIFGVSVALCIGLIYLVKYLFGKWAKVDLCVDPKTDTVIYDEMNNAIPLEDLEQCPFYIPEGVCEDPELYGQPLYSKTTGELVTTDNPECPDYVEPEPETEVVEVNTEAANQAAEAEVAQREAVGGTKKKKRRKILKSQNGGNKNNMWKIYSKYSKHW